MLIIYVQNFINKLICRYLCGIKYVHFLVLEKAFVFVNILMLSSRCDVILIVYMTLTLIEVRTMFSYPSFDRQHLYHYRIGSNFEMYVVIQILEIGKIICFFFDSNNVKRYKTCLPVLISFCYSFY